MEGLPEHTTPTKRRLPLRRLLPLLVLGLLAACTQAPQRAEVETRLQGMHQLATTEYILRKVVVANDSQWYTIGERKVLIVMRASVIAGVDLQQLRVIEMDWDDMSISLQIPAPEIILLNIPPEGIEYSFQQVDFTRADFTHAELQQIEALGEAKIREQVDKLNILSEAETSTRAFLESFLRSMGFQQIAIARAGGDGTLPELQMPADQ